VNPLFGGEISSFRKVFSADYSKPEIAQVLLLVRDVAPELEVALISPI
jgi:hypothetical protein